MPDARAYGWCSLGPLTTDPSTFADDQLQGSGIIKTKGTVNLQGIHRPAPGTPVSFGYSDGQNWLARIPRRLRVLSSVPNPLTLTTEVSVGCLFTYFENRQPALKNPTARAENSSVPDVAWKAATLPISAAYVFQQCCTALGLTVSGGIPLTNAYVVDEFDLSAGYIEEMGKLAVSEGWFVRLNEAEQVVFVSKQQEGGSGPLLQRGDLIDFNPVNVGDLPGEAVIARYTTSRLVPPPIDSSTPVQEGTRIMQARNWEYDSSTQIGVAVESRQVDGKLVSTFYYYNQIDETRTNYNDKELATSRVNTRTTILAALASSYTAQTGSNGGAAGTFETRTTYEYDTDGELTEEIEIEYAPEAALVGGAVNQYTFPDGNVSIGMGQSIQKTSTTRYARNKEENITKTYITELVARGQTAWGAAQISEASQQATTANEAQGVLGLALGLVPGTNVVKVHIGRGYGTQKRPGAAQRTAEANSKAGTNAPTVEETAEISWVLGSPAAETFIELSPPYAPDDRIVYAPSAPNPNAYLPGDFSVIRSDADVKATNYARIENRLLLGNRNGSGVQILPELLPPEPFAPVYVRLNGCTAEFRVNGAAWTISADGATCTTDLLFWNAVDASDFANVWFPTAPGISSLPSTVPVTPSANPLPANAVAIPAGFDLNRPDLATLFGTILPSGVAPVWANSAAPAVGYPPYNETVELRGGVGVGGVIEALQWAPTEVELIGGVGVGAVVEPMSVVVLADGGAMQLSGAAATITAAMFVSAEGGGLAISGGAATITTSASGGGGNVNRISGLHLDGNLLDTVGNNAPSGGGLTFITTGQKFGSGAVTVDSSGYLSLSADTKAYKYPIGQTTQGLDFAFRFWIKIPNNTGDAALAGSTGGDGTYSSFGCYIRAGVLKWEQNYNGTATSQSFGSVPVNTWAFIEIGRISGVIRASIDGIVSANSLSMNPSLSWEDAYMYAVGYFHSMSVTIDDFEFLTGEGPQVANFTPPTAAFI
jgi:hypothetical protein